MSVAFKANQLKSAIGNSGAFNLHKSSLTDSNSLDLVINRQQSLRKKFNPEPTNTEKKLNF